MSALNSKSRRPYTFEEEVWSCAIHGLGIVLSIAGLTTLVALAARYRDVSSRCFNCRFRRVDDCSIYGINHLSCRAQS